LRSIFEAQSAVRSAPAGRRTPARNARTAFLAVALCACTTAAEHRRAADEEVYAIVTAARAELGAGGAFSIDPPADSLRARVVEAQQTGTPLLLAPLGFLECLEIAGENSRDFQSRRETLYRAALDLTLERWLFGFRESATGSATVTGTDGAVDTIAAGGGYELSRIFGTGASIVGGIGIDLFRSIVGGGGWGSGSSVSLSAAQPLMRGFGSEIVLEPLTQAERNVVYGVRDYERFRRTFAFDVASRMFRIAQQVDTLANQRQNQESLKRIRERNEAFAEAGQLLDIEVDQARQDELRAQNNVVETQRTLEGLYDDFKLFLGLPVDTDLSIRDEELKDLFGLVVPEIEFSEAVGTRIALARRLDHMTDLDRVDDAERDVVIAADRFGMGLDLVASAGAASDAKKPLDYSDAQVGWSVGLDLDLPIDQLAERNGYRVALIGLDATRRAAEQSTDFVRADVREALRELAAAREQVVIQELSVALAERRVESSAMQQDAGRADTRTVLESQESLVQAQNAAVQARVDYTLARLALYRDMELLRVDETGLWVDTEPLESEPSDDL
jgi:outer membrane protein TolC